MTEVEDFAVLRKRAGFRFAKAAARAAKVPYNTWRAWENGEARVSPLAIYWLHSQIDDHGLRALQAENVALQRRISLLEQKALTLQRENSELSIALDDLKKSIKDVMFKSTTEIGESDGDLVVSYYDNGEASATYSSNGPGDYYLWSVKQQQRLHSWKTATEMWAHAKAALSAPPDQYGLVVLNPPSEGPE